MSGPATAAPAEPAPLAAAEPADLPLPGHVVAMVRRTAPADCHVIPGSTPVVAFGDPRTAEVATLGINPSRVEFCGKDGQLLTGDQRRLATTASLGLIDLAHATDEQVHQVVADCAGYFSRNPYMSWFGHLNKVLGLGCDVSYLDGTACHLDLVQWATDPVWGQLPKPPQEQLLADGVPHLQAQLTHDNIRLVLLNGAQVISHVQAVGLVRLEQVGSLPYPAGTTKLVQGTAAGVRFLGWSVNIQSNPGANAASFLTELGAWIRKQNERAAGAEGPDIQPDGALPRGLHLSGLAELRSRLSAWLQGTDDDTIGDVGSFGGTPWMHVDLGGQHIVLNADTKRTAVAAFLQVAEPVLQVVANRRGVVNKVVFRPDGTPTPGWYAYTAQPLHTPTAL